MNKCIAVNLHIRLGTYNLRYIFPRVDGEGSLRSQHSRASFNGVELLNE